MLEMSIVIGIIGTDNENKMQPLNIYVPSIFPIQENNFKLEKKTRSTFYKQYHILILRAQKPNVIRKWSERS